ncbi:hypothetical protein FRC17_004513, partial [Serendipita sp. 399]
MSKSSAQAKGGDKGKELEELLSSIQRDPKSAAAALPKLSKDELLNLFALFVDDDDDDSNKGDNKTPKKLDLRSSAYLALSSFVGVLRHPSSNDEPDVPQNVDQEQELQNQSNATRTLARAFYPVVEEVLRGSNISQLIAVSSFLSALFQVDAPSASLIFIREGNSECILDAIELVQATDEGTKNKGQGRRGPSLQLALTILLSHVMGQSECRKLFGETPSSSSVGGKVLEWLGQVAEGSKDSRVKASAALALVKLMQGRIQDIENAQSGIPATRAETSGIAEVTGSGVSSVDGLAELLEGIIISSTSTTNISTSTSSSTTKLSPPVVTNHRVLREAVEGLAYLSVHPSIREYIASQPKLLKSLFAAGIQSTKKTKPSSSISSSRLPEKDDVSPMTMNEDHRLNLGLHYGLALILANLCQYRPRLSKEEEQIARLRRMTKPAGGAGTGERTTMGAQDEGEDPRTTDLVVSARVKKLCVAGMLPLLAGLARSESRSARECTSRTYLCVVEDQSNRGEVLKHGGGRALLDIIKLHPSSSSSPLAPSKGTKDGLLVIPDWNAIQALSKLAITASPLQVFGPDIGVTYDAIPPFCSVVTFADLLSSSSASRGPLSSVPPAESRYPTSLQRFEALMALTNVASMGPEVAERIGKTKGLLNAVENGLLEEHEMLRRANVELLCNLVVCEAVFERFVPPPTATTTTMIGTENESGGGGAGSAAESRLQVLVALADVVDASTRKAASGALAMLSSDER